DVSQVEWSQAPAWLGVNATTPESVRSITPAKSDRSLLDTPATVTGDLGDDDTEDEDEVAMEKERQEKERVEKEQKEREERERVEREERERKEREQK
mgnify:CR=1